jgi:nucleotidyltransferase substrate binding protein (TIGR01987 family)
MDSLKAKHKQLLQALSTFSESIFIYKNITQRQTSSSSDYTYEQEYRAFRESMIQRFEFCTELFWKYIKLYLEYAEVPSEYTAPVPVIRTAYTAGFLSEQEAEDALEMIKDRNRTSHIYKEEIAELLAKKIPQHYQLMYSIATRIAEKEL